MVFKKFYFSIIALFLISSCGTYRPQFKDKNANPIFPSDKKIAKTFYLVGDAGLSPMGDMSDALTIFKNYLKNETPGNYTLYLGDNIYPNGLEAEGHPRRKFSENMLDAQQRAVSNYNGQTIFIPGNHEWYSEGVLGVTREE